MGYPMTITAICIVYFVIVLSLTRLVHVLRAQEHRMRENRDAVISRIAPDAADDSKAAA